MRQKILDALSVYKNPYLTMFSALLFFTPLVYTKATSELFEFPKIIFVYILGGFCIAFFFTEVILKGKKIVIPSIQVLFFLLFNLVSTIFSSHTYTSVFGYYSRFNDSLISTAVFLSLYIISKSVFSKEDFAKLLKVSLYTIVPISALGIYQYIGGVDRVFSTFGQPNWLGQYLCMLLPICIYLSLAEDFKLWLPVYLLGFSCLWFTYSISAVFGFLLSTVFLFFVYIKRSGLNKVSVSRLLILVFFSLVISSSNLGMFRGKLHDAYHDLRKHSLLVSDVYAFSEEYKISDPGFIRLELWKSTINLIKSSPKIFLIGTGPETYPYEIQRFRNLNINYTSEWDFVFNKPHNYFLEVFSELGIFGLFSFLFLLVWVFKKLPYFLKIGLIGFTFANFFGWPTVATSLLFWFFISYGEVYKE